MVILRWKLIDSIIGTVSYWHCIIWKCSITNSLWHLTKQQPTIIHISATLNTKIPFSTVIFDTSISGQQYQDRLIWRCNSFEIHSYLQFFQNPGDKFRLETLRIGQWQIKSCQDCSQYRKSEKAKMSLDQLSELSWKIDLYKWPENK